MPDFVTICNVDELNPGGEPIVVEINNKWIGVFNVGGEIYAIEDVCTHDGGPLAEGKLEGWVIECPRHGATFDVRTGEALSAPAYEDVSAYEVKVVDNEIKIGPRKT